MAGGGFLRSQESRHQVGNTNGFEVGPGNQGLDRFGQSSARWQQAKSFEVIQAGGPLHNGNVQESSPGSFQACFSFLQGGSEVSKGPQLSFTGLPSESKTANLYSLH